MEKNYIVSVGGSLIAPDSIDLAFLKKFKDVVSKAVKRGGRFFIVPGGGRTCRNYQKIARTLNPDISDKALDWIGIYANRLHSFLLLGIFEKHAYPEVVMPEKIPQKFRGRILVTAGGVKPGWTSDSTSLYFAQKFGVKTIVNLTNVDGVFDKDPKRYKKVKLIHWLTWRQFRLQFGKSHKPGQHQPFDSVAARVAERSKIRVVILNGRKLENFMRFLSGKSFRGTIIE